MSNRFDFSEVLYDNLLDKEIQGMFCPFNFIQLCFLAPRYRIYKGFITFNSTAVDILSSISFIIPCALYLWNQIPFIKSIFSYFLYISMTFDVIFRLVGFVMSYTLNLVHRKLNVELVLNIQRTFKMFKYKQYKQFRSFNIASWLAIGTVLMYHLLLMSFFFFNGRNLLVVVLNIFIFYLNVSVVFASRIIAIIRKQLTLWISELTAVSKLTTEREVKFVITTTPGNEDKVIRINYTEDETRQEWNRLFEIYKKIFETYDIYKKIFQPFLFYHCVETMYYSITYSKGLIEIEKYLSNDKKIRIEGLGLAVSALKNFLINCFISFSCEDFYITVDKAKLATVEVLSGNTSLDAQRACKNILRLKDANFSKIDVYRLFVIDSNLPLLMISTIAYYVIVVIQFAIIED